MFRLQENDMPKQFVPYDAPVQSTQDSEINASKHRHFMDSRRSLRAFSPNPVPRALIEDLIMTASSAPSGAHKQPWSFCAISSAEIKKQIREGAEAEEYENYHGRMSEEWLKDLQAFDTDWNKPFLEVAPWLIVVFRKPYDLVENEKKKNYYVAESVGIACGFLISAIHHAGLVTLTHTPSPMNFLTKILKRPENEKPYLLLPVGYPADDALVPKLKRKAMKDVASFY